jgi:hypothetical protein
LTTAGRLLSSGRRSLVLATILSGAACSDPPVKEIGAAEAALAQARQAGADTFAPDRWKEAESALALARRKVQEKDYRGALSAASDSAEKSKVAVQAAEAAKLLARSAAETAEAEAQALLDDVNAVRRTAAENRVPDKVFAPLQPSLDTAKKDALAITAAIERGEFGEARRLALELRSKIETLPGRYREAMEKWQTAHGRRRAARPSAQKP